MYTKILKKVTSILAALVLLLPVISAVPLRADAASIVSITIDNITRRYKDAAKWLGYVNDYRSSRNLPSLTMDAAILEKAMKHAAELSVHVSDSYLDGSSFMYEGSGEHYVVCCYGQYLNQSEIFSDNKLVSAMNSSAVKSIGIGVVDGYDNIRYLVFFISSQNPNAVDSSVLTQSNVKMSQDTDCLASYLSTVDLNFPEKQAFACGSEAIVRYVVTNDMDVECKAYVSAASNLTSSDESIFKVTGANTIMGIQPGNAVVTMSMKSCPSVSVSHTYYAKSSTFKDCTISAIADQIYSGVAITPDVKVTKNDGTVLTVGKDYTLTYYNNINVGTAGVVVTGMGGYAGRSGTTTFKIVKNANAFAATISLNKSEMELGETVKVSASSTNGTGTIKYTFDYCAPGTSTYTVAQSSSTASSCSVKPVSIGKYTFRVTAVDGSGKKAIATTELNIHAALKLSATVSTSSTTVGNSVTVRGSASGGVTPYKYEIGVKTPGNTAYTTISALGTTNSCVYSPKEAGAYEFRIKGYDSYGSTVYAYQTVNVTGGTFNNTSTISTTVAGIGTKIVLKGSATGGKPGYKFTYSYKKSTDSSWTIIGTPNSTVTSADFTPTAKGTYTAKVAVMDGDGVTKTKSFDISVGDAVSALVNNSTISATSISLGKSVTLTGKASGGAGSYKYAFQYKKSTSSSWSTSGTAYGTATTATITPSAAATYNVRVMVKDKYGTVVTKTFNLTVTSNALTNNSTMSATSAVLGNGVTLKGAASGGAGSYKYAFQYKKSSSSSWNTIGTAYGTAVSATLKPGSSGTFDVRVLVKDSAGTISSKSFTLKVTASTLANNSTISSTSINLGQSVTLKGAASGGSGSFKYAFQYKRASSSSWNTVGTAYGTATTASFTPSSADSYNVRVIVKDSTGATASKSFSLKVTKSVLSNNSTISTSTVQKGNNVTLKGAASGGAGSYKYAFFFKRSYESSWKTAGTKYGTSTSEVITPSAEYVYDIMIKVKDAAGTEIAKTFSLVVHNGTLVNTSKPDSATVAAGTAVKLNGTARGGTKPYTFAYYYKLNTASSWTTLSGYSSNASASFTPKTKGTYNIKVKAKDAVGNTAEKTFNVTVS